MAFLTADPIDLGPLWEAVSDPGCGAATAFVGTVRAGPEDGPVVAIEYTAHDAMAELEFGKITSETQARWPGVRMAGRHRLGRVPLGEASIAIVVAAPHRAAALAAVDHAVAEAKRRLPVWKREHFQDGTTAWRENDAAGAGAGTIQ